METVENKIKALKTQRANKKRYLTSYETFLKGYDPSHEYPSLQKRYIEIEKVRKGFEEIQSELDILMMDEQDSEKNWSEFEAKYYWTYNLATALISKNPTQSNSIPTGTSSSSPLQLPSIANQTISPSPSIGSLSLPKINLPTFSGSYESWPGFHDLFNSLVNQNESITELYKLYYLKGCLTGEAADLIASIESSAENHGVAWSLLKERYDNTKVIVRKHTQAIIRLPPLTKESSIQSFLDTIQKHLRSLKSLGEPVETWSALLVYTICEKFNHALMDKFDEFTEGKTIPTMTQVISFLQRRAESEDTKSSKVSANPIKSVIRKSPHTRSSPMPQHTFVAVNKPKCTLCQESHYITSCKQFLNLVPKERFESAKRNSLCINCLRKNHKVTECPSSKCRQCGSRHHTLLHFEKDISQAKPNNNSLEGHQVSAPNTINLSACVSTESVLATALVDIINDHGKSKTCRVFLDAGSQAHFMTESIAQFLELPKKSSNLSVSGIEGISTNIKHSVCATVKSRFSQFRKRAEFLVLPRITHYIPSTPINVSNLDIPKNITLADPDFHKPADIDALIGVKLFYKMLCVGQISLKGHPNAVLQKTQLGWVLAGELENNLPQHKIRCHLTVNHTPTDVNLTRFWEMEEIATPTAHSPEEIACEEHYNKHTTRTSEGRYMVRLPFNCNKNSLGDSYNISLNRFLSLERKLNKNTSFKNEYGNFLREYQALNHMSPPESPNTIKPCFYLPHHAVIKQDSSTSKIRVVFDGSAKTSSGISLNDTLMVGPKLQDDLFSIIIRFRTHPIALTADIEKMYRQVLVHPDDCHYQKILFREDQKDIISEHILNTVTYGTSCASFLAIRTLQQLAKDEGHHHPIAAEVLTRDFYVDDVLTGADDRSTAVTLRDELIKLLKRGGFNLRKWVSNDISLTGESSNTSTNTHFALDLDCTTKTLGIHWNARQDTIHYSVSSINSPSKCTKRVILSQIAKLFDPLGLLGPVITYAKIIMQLLWKAGVSWDESIPHTLWQEYREQLPLLENISFKRLIIAPNSSAIELPGFCDASERAYGACLYLRSIDQYGNITVNIICSKSRVAPVIPVTLPRLELCAALVLSRLFTAVKDSLLRDFDKTYLWSDSRIALQWIKTPPHLLKTFVSNRVAEIQKLTQNCQWRHVPSEDNPADLISRGQTPRDFNSSSIWQTGPTWLYNGENTWPNIVSLAEEVPEIRKKATTSLCVTNEEFRNELLRRYSSLSKLKRVLSLILRFSYNVQRKGKKRLGVVQAFELENAMKLILKLTQLSVFDKDIKMLQSGTPILSNSKLSSLSPFLDNEGILRVGGRLRHADLPYAQKYPALLPSNHHITWLIINDSHVKLKHAGAQATLYSVRESYWPLGGRNTARKVIRACIPCFRAKPRTAEYLMGNLPKDRVNFARPFLNVGVDYCGPMHIKEKRFRNRNSIKVYVAVFVCMCTKAVHLELVSDLTTEGFIASLKRLFSRRGKASTIYSDNATNFVGASRELKSLYDLLVDSDKATKIENFLAGEKITWHFIPPRSPNFGGLWEAAVKSFKNHLVRTVGNSLLTYEQLETYVIEIEAILNSRPISPLSSDPNDLRPLTPGHFLIGGPVTSFPQIDFTDTSPNRLSAWQHAQQLKQHFWVRWHKEYLNELISRSKWHSQSTKSMKIGTLVLIKDENLAPLRWSLGRITAIHPGKDRVVRVVSVKTKMGEFKRPVTKLCPLPMDEPNNSATEPRST